MKCANNHISVLRQGLFSLLVFMAGMFAWNTNTLAAALSNGGVVGYINAERQAAGLPALVQDSRLNTSAYLKAQDMCDRHYWAHNAPDGTTPWSFVDRAGYNYVSVAENLAQGFNSDDALVAGWMASPGHRANILSDKYRDVGVASLTCNLVGTETTLVVAHFGSLAQAAPQPVAQPVARPAAQATEASQPVQQPVAAAPAPEPAPQPAAPKQPSFIDQLISQLKATHELALFKRTNA